MVTAQEQRQDAALALIEAGFAIVPIPEGQKAPTLPDWQHLASSDPETVLRWLQSGQYGVLPQPGSRLLVVDVDRPDALAGFPPLPKTLIVDTAKGFHVYARLPDGDEEQDVPRTFEGGEVRVAGSGQVVGPWSLHPSGAVYTPRNGSAIGELSRDWLAALQSSHKARSAAQRDAQGPDDPGWYLDNGRHEHLVEKGRWLRGHGLTGERLLDELIRLDHDRHRPPIATLSGRGMAEIQSIAIWIERHIADDPPPPVLAPTPPGELRFYNPRELAALTLPCPDWIAGPGLVAIGAITEIDGKIKAAGKTTLILWMVRAVLEGEPFLGQPSRQAHVLYVTEQSRQTFADALRRTGLEDRGDELRVLFREDIGATPWPAVVAATRQDGYDLVIFDTIGKLAGIREENHAGEWALAMAPLQDLAAAGRAVIVARHDRKGGGEVGDSGRGSSQASGDVDVILALRRPEGKQPGTRRVIESLSRYPDTPEKMVIELLEDGYRFLGTEEAVAAAAAEEFVVFAIGSEYETNGSGATAKELAELGNERDPKVRPGAINTALRILYERGRLQRTGSGHKGDPWRYTPLAADSFLTQTIGNERINETEEELLDQLHNGLGGTP